MRTLRLLLSLLLAVAAGLLTALSVAGARLDALAHTPEPLQEIAGPVVELDSVQRDLPPAVSGAVRDQIPDLLPAQFEEGIVQLVEGAAEGLLSDDRFTQAWSDTLEQTRTDWLAKLDAARSDQSGSALPADAATVEMQIGPIADLGQDRIVEGLRQIPFGEMAADAVEENTQQDHRIALDLNVPDPEVITPQQVVWLEQNVRHWPWLAAGAVLSLVLSLLLAPGRQRFTALATAGVTAAAAGVAGRYGLESMEAVGTTGVAHAVADGLIAGVREYALPDTTLIIVGGGVAVAVAVLGMLIGSARSGTPRVASSR